MMFIWLQNTSYKDNMRKIKKIFITGICFIAILVNQNVCFAVEGNEKPLDMESIYNEYKNDQQYLLMLEDYGEAYAKQFLEDVLASRIQSSIMPLGGGGNECYQYVTNIRQTTNSNCGSTTVLQTLYGLGSASQVSGSTDSAKISTIDKENDVATQGSLFVYQAVNALNKYSTRTYTYVVGSSLTEATFEQYIATSLTNSKPVILHARTQYIGYYGGHASGHYLSLDYVNRTTDIVRIVDCNYQDSYYGIHYVSLSEAYKSIHDESGRYLIY